MQIPIGLEDKLEGVIDLLTMKALKFEGDFGQTVKEEEIPKDLAAEAKKWQKKLIEKIAAEDEKLLEKYLAGKKISVDELRKVLRKAVLEYKLVPVFCGSALKNKGIQAVLDAVIYYLPSPNDLPPVKGTDPKTGKEIERKPDDKEAFSALAFKVATDPFVGALTYFRVYSGTLKKGSYLLNTSSLQRNN